MRSNCFPSFFYQNSGSRLGREPFSPKEAPRFEGLLRGGQPEPPAGRSAHRKLGARRRPLTWRPPGCGRAWEGGGGLTPRTCLSGEALVHCETPRSWRRTPSPASTRHTQRAGVGGDQLRGATLRIAGALRHSGRVRGGRVIPLRGPSCAFVGTRHPPPNFLLATRWGRYHHAHFAEQVSAPPEVTWPGNGRRDLNPGVWGLCCHAGQGSPPTRGRPARPRGHGGSGVQAHAPPRPAVG